MSKFSKGKKRKNPAISTAALPDIVFMLLFFFMVTTKPRKDDSFAIVKEPVLTQTQILDKDANKVYYHIGKSPLNPEKEEYTLWVDDEPIANTDYRRIQKYLKNLRAEDEYATSWDELLNVFKIDENAPMGMVQKIQEQLRDAEALKVMYTSDKPEK
jgi:biopolymer transport protein ExbD